MVIDDANYLERCSAWQASWVSPDTDAGIARIDGVRVEAGHTRIAVRGAAIGRATLILRAQSGRAECSREVDVEVVLADALEERGRHFDKGLLAGEPMYGEYAVTWRGTTIGWAVPSDLRGDLALSPRDTGGGFDLWASTWGFKRLHVEAGTLMLDLRVPVINESEITEHTFRWIFENGDPEVLTTSDAGVSAGAMRLRVGETARPKTYVTTADGRDVIGGLEHRLGLAGVGAAGRGRFAIDGVVEVDRTPDELLITAVSPGTARLVGNINGREIVLAITVER